MQTHNNPPVISMTIHDKLHWLLIITDTSLESQVIFWICFLSISLYILVIFWGYI